ncbi:hypothetical protein BO71DRAFT_49166 [Aspergillus ellipticus CBS 707.79]|uniref:Uncharacterized protein n=1 Tax=Aspergillus ellipticus CBS 707.79 TaxID=1448320 RepID=A0A319DLI1_9EURO|nr:hypothetical protein BO71DRAFT_49166 [Aspergillus ellipticus CBS 707.79]
MTFRDDGGGSRRRHPASASCIRILVQPHPGDAPMMIVGGLIGGDAGTRDCNLGVAPTGRRRSMTEVRFPRCWRPRSHQTIDPPRRVCQLAWLDRTYIRPLRRCSDPLGGWLVGHLRGCQISSGIWRDLAGSLAALIGLVANILRPLAFPNRGWALEPQR